MVDLKDFYGTVSPIHRACGISHVLTSSKPRRVSMGAESFLAIAHCFCSSNLSNRNPQHGGLFPVCLNE